MSIDSNKKDFEKLNEEFEELLLIGLRDIAEERPDLDRHVVASYCGRAADLIVKQQNRIKRLEKALEIWKLNESIKNGQSTRNPQKSH